MRDGSAAAAAGHDNSRLARRIEELLAAGSTTWSWTAIWTAPDHFLGNYPADKFRHFADALPRT